mmetsp:Transcript_34458/g.78592  ORF Transcript_34458/g.78592 Transcript_34458/m.78592 type:complete len:333 (+) Transcript_34458:1199-2197(+)
MLGCDSDRMIFTSVATACSSAALSDTRGTSLTAMKVLVSLFTPAHTRPNDPPPRRSPLFQRILCPLFPRPDESEKTDPVTECKVLLHPPTYALVPSVLSVVSVYCVEYVSSQPCVVPSRVAEDMGVSLLLVRSRPGRGEVDGSARRRRMSGFGREPVRREGGLYAGCAASDEACVGDLGVAPGSPPPAMSRVATHSELSALERPYGPSLLSSEDGLHPPTVCARPRGDERCDGVGGRGEWATGVPVLSEGTSGVSQCSESPRYLPMLMSEHDARLTSGEDVARPPHIVSLGESDMRGDAPGVDASDIDDTVDSVLSIGRNPCAASLRLTFFE